MRLPISVPPDITEWFERIDEAPRLRGVIKTALDAIIIANKSVDRKQLLDSIANLPSEDVKNLLQNFVSRLPANWHAANFQSSLQLGLLADKWITLDLLTKSELIEEFQKGTWSYPVGSLREKVFENEIYPIAKLSKSLEIVDPYLAGQLTRINEDQSKSWWFTQFLQFEDLNIKVISTCPRDIFHKDFLSRLDKSVAAIRLTHPNFAGTIRFEIFNRNSSIFHNRSLRFIFEQNDIAVESTNSFDNFGRKKFTERMSLSRIPPEFVSRDIHHYRASLRFLGKVTSSPNSTQIT